MKYKEHDDRVRLVLESYGRCCDLWPCGRCEGISLFPRINSSAKRRLLGVRASDTRRLKITFLFCPGDKAHGK